MKVLTLLIFLFSPSLYAKTNIASICGSYLEKMPIRQAGRTKPLYVHSREIFQYLLGKSSPKGYSAVDAYCRLSFSSLEQSSIQLNKRVDHVELKNLLAIGEKNEIPYPDLKKSPF